MSKDNQEEYIYGEVLLDSEQQVRVAESVNEFLLKDRFIDEPLTKPDEVIGLSLRSIVNLVEHVSEQIYEPAINKSIAEMEEGTAIINDLRGKLAEQNQRVKETETVQAELNKQIGTAQKTIDSLSQQLAEHQAQERNNLQH